MLENSVISGSYPDELVLKAKAQVALRDLKGFNVFSEHW